MKCPDLSHTCEHIDKCGPGHCHNGNVPEPGMVHPATAKSWWQRRKARNEAIRYDHGYCWAAGQILRDGHTQGIEQELTGIESGPFEMGVIHAMQRAIRLGLREAPPAPFSYPLFHRDD